MHLIAAAPGGWNPNEDEIFYIEQSQGDVVFLSAADTELYTLQQAYQSFCKATKNAYSLRLCNLCYLKQELTIDTYMDEVVSGAKVVIARLLGGENYYPYLVESLLLWQASAGQHLQLLPAHETDISLIAKSSVTIDIAHRCNQYLQEGGKENYHSLLQYLNHHFFHHKQTAKPLQSIPEVFVYRRTEGIIDEAQIKYIADKKSVVVIAYKTHYAANQLTCIHQLCETIESYDYRSEVVFVSNLRDESQRKKLNHLLLKQLQTPVCIITTNGFTMRSETETLIFETLKVPVIQAIFSSVTMEDWEQGSFGLSPTDIAMNVALPEMDGRIISSAIAFKKQMEKDSLTDSLLVNYEPHLGACDFIASQVKNWERLQEKKARDKKIALILPNYPNKDSRLANGVGLDTPESAVVLLRALKKAGYQLGATLPQNGTELMHWLTQMVTNDNKQISHRPHSLDHSLKEFNHKFATLSTALKDKIKAQWGDIKDDPHYRKGGFAIAGFLLANVFISIQPSRGYHNDPQAIYHSPDLPPTYYYLAYYFWVQDHFNADAVIHLGKHGNLEWLPGKSVALDENTCFPMAIFGRLPHFYPFIINDPGEGTQAKRRNQAVIIDHLIPPMIRAEQHGSLLELEHLVEEYYQALGVDKKRSKILEQKISQLVFKTKLHEDLNMDNDDLDALLVKLDGYLCELKEAQIRDGLHVFGQAPTGQLQTDLILALHRNPNEKAQSIPEALAKDLGIAPSLLQQPYETFLAQTIAGVFCRTIGKAVEQIEHIAQKLLNDFLADKSIATRWQHTQKVFLWIAENTLPKIAQTTDEMTHLLQGLAGKYVPAGASGAPTRGRLDLLPTGRNFYSLDVRTIPTETAYELGIKSANQLIERYLQEHGDYPKAIGLSVWGTATMRTGGDDIAQAFALMGVRPIWKSINRSVKDVEIIPLLKLGRPRVDVTLRISGFFRDAFPEVINLFNKVVAQIATLDEPTDENPIKARFLKEQKEWETKGIPTNEARKRALYRVFGSKPGAYGAGLQGVIDEKNWRDASDLAKVYIQWGGYAYANAKEGVSAHEVFESRLKNLDVVLQNQDNREHDILDSDDYYQFQGGMANAVKATKGAYPEIYFGDHSNIQNPKIKTLKEELRKVYRSRVINPKWIKGVQRHGYKGAFEMSATLDYLFAYDATTDLVDDFMYEGITEAYLKDPQNLAFIQKNNPWAVKDMSERLLEAIQRGLWKFPKKETKDLLEGLYLEAEGLLE